MQTTTKLFNLLDDLFSEKLAEETEKAEYKSIIAELKRRVSEERTKQTPTIEEAFKTMPMLKSKIQTATRQEIFEYCFNHGLSVMATGTEKEPCLNISFLDGDLFTVWNEEGRETDFYKYV